MEPTIQDLIDKLNELITDPNQPPANRQCYGGQVQWLEGCRNWLIQEAAFYAAQEREARQAR